MSKRYDASHSGDSLGFNLMIDGKEYMADGPPKFWRETTEGNLIKCMKCGEIVDLRIKDLVLHCQCAESPVIKCFFAFADTVATRRFHTGGNGRGWLGIRFQTRPREEPSEIIIHAHLLDSTATGEQAALGILGVNLIYAAFVLRDEPAKLIASLMDDLSRDRIEIDMIELTGPAFPNVDHRLMSLQLVEGGLTDAAMFTGTNEHGQIDASRLRSWLCKSQALAREHARKEIGEFVIGQLLARSPIGADEVWPCEPVREVLEELGTAEIARGLSNGVYNSRGAVWREEGGGQERGLAEKYRSWSGSLANQYPFVAKTLADIAATYDRHAVWEDTEARVRQRLTY